MADPSVQLKTIFLSLLKVYGPRKWWPAKTRLEIIISAILTQNVSWSNAKKALTSLKQAGLLNVSKLKQSSPSLLAPYIRSSRFYNQKSQKIKAFIKYLVKKHSGSIGRMFSMDMDALRQDLLGINGIGKETADSILLYAGNKPSFVSDAYTKRFVTRYGLLKGEPKYDEIRDCFMRLLPKDVYLYNEFHALIVHHGYAVCKAKPMCDNCAIKNISKSIYCNFGQTSRGIPHHSS